MASIEKTARTAEEAIQLALQELGLPRERVEVEILEESRSLLGILGTTQARVRVTSHLSLGEGAAHTLTEMLAHMGVEAKPKVIEEDDSQVVIDIEGTELGLLIGKHGQTLAALQHLLGLMVNRGEENRKRIILDAEGYRARREESLRHLALGAARRAQQTGEAITLDPLLPHERRIIHTVLADEPGVTTRSIGEDPVRRIVIEPRGAARPGRRDGRGGGYPPGAPRRPEEPEPELPGEGPESEGDEELKEEPEGREGQ
jgi:spoIIIJ-associated protein